MRVTVSNENILTCNPDIHLVEFVGKFRIKFEFQGFSTVKFYVWHNSLSSQIQSIIFLSLLLIESCFDAVYFMELSSIA